MERITKIYTEIFSPENEENKRGITNKVGTTFDNVFLSKEDSFTLLDLYKHYRDFLNQKMFTAYSKNNPAQYSTQGNSVLVWYEIPSFQEEEENNNND